MAGVLRVPRAVSSPGTSLLMAVASWPQSRGCSLRGDGGWAAVPSCLRDSASRGLLFIVVFKAPPWPPLQQS